MGGWRALGASCVTSVIVWKLYVPLWEALAFTLATLTARGANFITLGKSWVPAVFVTLGSTWELTVSFYQALGS